MKRSNLVKANSIARSIEDHERKLDTLREKTCQNICFDFGGRMVDLKITDIEIIKTLTQSLIDFYEAELKRLSDELEGL